MCDSVWVAELAKEDVFVWLCGSGEILRRTV